MITEETLIDAVQRLPRAVHFCAWCRRHFSRSRDGKVTVYLTATERDEPISHGICHPCAAEQYRLFEHADNRTDRTHGTNRTVVPIAFGVFVPTEPVNVKGAA